MKTTWIVGLGVVQGVLAASFLSLLPLLSLPTLAATSAEATTPEFKLSIKHDGIRASAGEETLRYSPFWDGGSNETAKVTLKQCDVVLSKNLTAEGDYVWSVSANGIYNLTHTTFTNGAVAKVLNATFVVTGKDIPFPPGSVTATGWNGKYDGNGHSISVTTEGIANPAITYSRNAAGPFEATNPSFTNVCDETVWCVIAADGYITQTNSAKVVIAQGDIGGGGKEPGSGEIPEGGLSKFDATYVYDGEGHTINTQAVFAVTLAGATPSFSFSLTENGTYQPDPMVYTNVGEYVIWYQITAPNYSPYKHQAKVTIKTPVHEHDGIVFDKMLTKDFHGGKLEAGNYFFFDDIDLTESVICTNGPVRFCLNGKVLNAHGRGFSVVRNFTETHVYDCGKDVHYFDASILPWSLTNETCVTAQAVVGGVITSGDGGYEFREAGIDSTTDAKFSMYGGNVVGCRNGGNSGCGGGIFAHNLYLRGVKILGNRADLGAALFLDDGAARCDKYSCPASAEIVDCEIVGNRSAGQPCGLVTLYGESVISNTVITNNIARSVIVDAETNATIRGGCVANNIIYNGTGDVRGLSVNRGSVLKLVDDPIVSEPIRIYVNGLLDLSGDIGGTNVYSVTLDVIWPDQGLPTIGSPTTVTVPCGRDLSSRVVSHDPAYMSINAGSGDNQVVQFVVAGVATPVVDATTGTNYVYGATPGSVAVSAHAVNDGETLSYQWFEIVGTATNKIVGATSAAYALPTGRVVGIYTFFCEVTALNPDSGRTAMTRSATVSAVVTQASLTVTAKNKTIKFNEAAANDGVTYQGFIGGEDESVLGGELAYAYGTYTAGSPVGTYPIVPSGLTSANYAIAYVNGTLEVTDATVDPKVVDPVDPDPGDPFKPYSSYDATYLYDGEGHTINTQALFAVTLPGAVPSFSFVPDVGGLPGGQPLPADGAAWSKDAPTYTNSGEYVVWYRITAPNYSNFVHAAKVTITRPACMIKNVVAHQRYPWNGEVDIDFTIESPDSTAKYGVSFSARDVGGKTNLVVGTLSYEGVSVPELLVAAGAYRVTWNADKDIGSKPIEDVELYVLPEDTLPGVQLWENGPYWAECNVGAIKPNEPGLYFWWGDTIGCVREGDKWNAADGSRIGVLFNSENCPTDGVGVDQLHSSGYVDQSGNLVAAYDSATARLGVPWRMPTGDEVAALVSNCVSQVIIYNGARGRQIVGKGKYSSKSIFLPEAGFGDGDLLCESCFQPYSVSSLGRYWSSSMDANYSGDAKGVYFSSYAAGYFGQGSSHRFCGQSVRAVRERNPIGVAHMNYMGHFSVRASLGEEKLRYSTLWDGGTNETARVTLSQDGVTLAENLTGEGEYNWSVAKPGLYTLTHSTYTNGAVAKTLTAQFQVAGVPVDPTEITVTPYEAEYDGAAHGISVVGPEGTVVKYCATSNGAYAAVATFKDVCTTQIWYEVSGGGYLAYTNSAVLKITPRAVTVTSKDISKPYDGTPLKLTAADITVRETTPRGEGAAGTVLPEGEAFVYGDFAERTVVGETPATFSIAAGANTKLSNYDISVVTGKIAVVKGTVPPGEDPEKPDPEHPLPPGGVSKFDGVAMYDGEGHALETNKLVEAFRGVIVGEFAVQYAVGEGGVRGAPALPWTTVPPVFTNSCEEIVWYKVSNPNYEDYIHAAKVTVTNRPITVTSANGSWVYDTTAHATNGVVVAGIGEEGTHGTAGTEGTVVVGLIGDDSIVVSGFPSITDVGTKANSFDWVFGTGTLATNYCVSCVTGMLEVTARIIGDDPENWDIRLDKDPKYSGEELSAPILQVAFRKPDGNLVDIPYTLAGDKATDAGNYTLKITGTGNYSGTVNKEWSIMPRNVMFTSATTNWIYDGVTHCASNVVVSGDGFVGEEGVTFDDFPEVKHVADAATPIANEFDYTLKDNTKSGNYDIKTTFGTVQMAKLPVTVKSKDISKPYDGSPLKLTAEDIVVSETTPRGEGAAGTVLPEGEAFSYADLAERTEAGQIAASFKVANGTALVDDYAITPVFGTLTITKSATEITITAKSKSWTYSGAEYKLNEYDATNLDVLQSTDSLAVTFDPASVITTPVDGPKGDGVVSNVITSVRVLRNGIEDVTKNYTLAWYAGELKVTKRPVTITSASASKSYDGTALTKHEVTVGGDSFVGEDGASCDYTGSQTAKGTSENTFTYSLNPGTEAAYYDITTAYGTLEVTAADITGGTEEDWEIVLGPSLTYTGLQQNQTITSVAFKGLPLDYTVSGNQQTDAGDYKLTLTGQGNFTGTHEVDWSISPKALTLTVGGGSKVYDGTALTVASVGAEGFAPNEGATYVCTGSQLDVGDSANVVTTINWNENTKGSNYTVTKNPGTLTVTPRPVTVTSKNISKPYDGFPLTLTAADIVVSETTPRGEGAAGTVLPEGESFVFGNFAERTESGQTPATFTIAAGPNTKLSNYTITPVYGTITITKSATEIGVTAKSQTWTYNGETHKLNEYEATNLGTLQPGDELHVEFDTASTVTSATDGPQGDGVVPNVIKVLRVLRNGTQDVTDNYTVTAYPGVLTVEKRPVSVVVVGKTSSVIYDGEEHTVTGYDISTEDELYDIAADTTFSGTASATGTDVATYKMNLKASDFANGNANFAVDYAVTDGRLTVSPLDIGAADVTCTIVLGANQKYNGTPQTVQITSVTAQRGAAAALPVSYTTTGQDATHAGTYTLTLKGTGNFTGEKSTTWEILKRQVTMTSGSATKVYDGSPLTKDEVTESGDGFIGVEGVTYTVTGSQMHAGTSKNVFTYTRKAGTKEEDYDIVEVEGDLTVKKADAKPGDIVVEPVDDPSGAGLGNVYTFDGKPHGINVKVTKPEGGTLTYSATKNGQYVEAMPLYKDVVKTSTWFRVESNDYNPYIGVATLEIKPKMVTTEMLTYSDDAFFFDGSKTKVPDVILVDTNDVGEVISTSNDWTRIYGTRLESGEWPVTLTGTNNYTGSATALFKNIKRPVAPPVIPSMAYNGNTRKPTVPTDSRWTVVSNPGGKNAGFYTNVVLRLTNTADYKWKGYAEDGPDTWTGVFEIRKASNGWSTYPGMKSWTNGVEKASEPVGKARYGTVSVAYRVRGAAVETETATKPTNPGKYTARFWVAESQNYAAVASREVDFEIFRGPNDPPEEDEKTMTTPVPVPYDWLAPYVAEYGGGDYEKAGNATGANGYKLWESYVAGLTPTDPTSKIRANITMSADGSPVITWSPDMSASNPPRTYTTYGKASLLDKVWTPVTDANKPQMRFFKVEVELK